MTVLVATETLLLVLLAILVAGLLRSHAEILRRLGPPADANAARPGDAFVAARPRAAAAAADIAGTTVDGEAIQVGLAPGGPSTLLAFLSAGCTTCLTFWESLAADGAPAVPGGARVIAVTRGPDRESPARLRELAPAAVPVVMSAGAWDDYAVPTTPYFVYVDGASARVHGEGAASSWEGVTSLLRDALDDAGGGRPSSGPARASRVDRELEAAGIGPDHPSLYPDRNGEEGPPA